MKYLHLAMSIFYLLMKNTAGYSSTVDCPSFSQTDILQHHGYDFSPLDCTLLMSCSDSFELSNNAAATTGSSRCLGDHFYNDDFLFDCYPENGHTCAMKHKVTMIRNWDFQSIETNSCRNSQDSSSLRPIPGNCSLFYKCDWGSAIMFECPADLHFNAELRVCDWPWQARCDSTWMGCPRPYPRCPPDYPRALYLPHPHLCDKFYQCDWGTPHLQTCPTGLHFNPTQKICDWPYKANCQVC